LIAFLLSLLGTMRESLRDLAPVIAVVAFFQLVVLRQPLPDTVALADLASGLLLVVLGLTCFVRGLQMGLFPIGEQLAHAFVSKASVIWLMVFAFALGFGTTVAEPALIAVAAKAGEAMQSEGALDAIAADAAGFALGLRLIVALAVGLAVMLGVLRILRGWPLHLLIIAGYLLVLLMTVITPREIIGIAYDAGGVTTSTITVPMLAALGVGLASVIKGRNPIIDGFGLIAFASLTPMLFVMGYGILLLGVRLP
jgi:hypothetical protein